MQKIDLDKLLTGNEHVFVKNTSKPKGKIIVNFTDGSTGATRPFNVPRTWIPICVSEAIPREVIRTSTDFRRYLANGLLTLLPQTEAQEIMTTEDAREELLRLNRSEFSSDTPFATQAAKELLAAVEAKSEITKQQAEQLKISDEQREKLAVNPAVLDICTRFNTKDLEGKMAVNELRIIEEELSMEDCSYIIANTDGVARNFAKTKLEVLMKETEN